MLFVLFVLASTMYTGYAMVLGQIDGLPPLPSALLPRDKETLPPLPPRPASRVVAKLQQAFGQECPEAHRQFKIELSSRNMVLAWDHFQIEPDGRVCLTPISVAIIDKDKGDGRGSEINSIRGQAAYLKFDRPVTQITDIGSRKILGGDILGNVEVVNNRRTAARDDDIVLFVPQGPVHYSEPKKLIWTNDSIHLSDHQSKPKPTEVRGKGLQIDLLAETKPVAKGGSAAATKPRQDVVTGVKRIKLNSAVSMHIHVADDAGFMANGPAATKKSGTVSKAHVAIKTHGTFEYVFGPDSDTATFLAPNLGPNSLTPADVTLTKLNDDVGAVDQLVCEKLVLTLRKRGPRTAIPEKLPTGSDQAIEITTAHATGKEVIITSDAEKLEAHAKELTFDNRTGKTILKGEPTMFALIDGNTITTKILEITQPREAPKVGKPRPAPTIHAPGPGVIELRTDSKGTDKAKLDKKDPIQVKGKTRAEWGKNLSTATDPESGMDLLTFQGKARFFDEGQSLQADTLKLWIGEAKGNLPHPAPNPLGQIPGSGVTTSNKPNPEAPPANKPRGKKEIQRLEAIGSVIAKSRELLIQDTGRLLIWFIDSPTKPKTGEAAPLTGVGKALPSVANPGILISKNPATSQGPSQPSLVPESKTDKPIEISARSIETWVNRLDNRVQLDRIRTEGQVVVRQESPKPGDKGVDIRGETLQLFWSELGSKLIVGGDLAQLRMDRILIVGPEITIDQLTNKVWVDGIGAMQMDSATNLQGVKLAKAIPFEVHWSKSMLFSGKHAEFTGDIQAEQEEARLASQGLQVFFDTPISLKEGTKRDASPKVEHIVCDRQVRVEETVREKDKLVRFQRIVAVTLSMNRLEREDQIGIPRPNSTPTTPAPTREANEVRATGPGEVRMLQRGGSDPFETKPPAPGQPVSTNAPKPPKAGEDGQLKMTHISFLKSMYANNRSNTATFLEEVRVLHFPCEDPNVEVELENVLDRLPPGAIFLRCDRLDALSRGEGKSARQDMRARGRVTVQAREFSGRAEMVTYEDAKEQVIFHGSEGAPAILLRQVRVGAPPEEIRARKITYSRGTGQFKIDDGQWLGGGS
ncbi:MAG: hypothetical protein EXS11_03615 [Gemmataceae bacterium]|nr:hypothetical protein [Gemmataceae bacterium]